MNMGGLLSTPKAPNVKMPPPPPPPAPMDTPEIAQPELQATSEEEMAAMNRSTGSKRKYRKRNVGSGKAGGHSGYQGGGLSGI